MAQTLSGAVTYRTSLTWTIDPLIVTLPPRRLDRLEQPR
jgi:hypothetical protein